MLETALRSLRPAPARIDPVAAALEAQRRTAPMRRRVWQVAAAAALIAAIGGAWLTLARRGEVENLAAAIDSPVPPATMLAYRQALFRSPADLGKLLDLQATSQRDQLMPVGAVTVWSASLRSLPGEM